MGRCFTSIVSGVRCINVQVAQLTQGKMRRSPQTFERGPQAGTAVLSPPFATLCSPGWPHSCVVKVALVGVSRCVYRCRNAIR